MPRWELPPQPHFKVSRSESLLAYHAGSAIQGQRSTHTLTPFPFISLFPGGKHACGTISRTDRQPENLVLLG